MKKTILVLGAAVLAMSGIYTPIAMATDGVRELKVTGATAKDLFETMTNPIAISKDFKINGIPAGELRIGKRLSCTNWYFDNSFECDILVTTKGDILAENGKF